MSTDLHEVKNEIRLALESKRNEVASRLHRLEEDIAVERVPDPIDQLGMLTQRESAITLLDRDTKLLREIDAALRRIGDGNFGRCALCGKKIGLARLRVVPWTSYCVACQEELDRSGARDEASFSTEEF